MPAGLEPTRRSAVLAAGLQPDTARGCPAASEGPSFQRLLATVPLRQVRHAQGRTRGDTEPPPGLPQCVPPVPLPLPSSETCKLRILEGLPRLHSVAAAGYGEYCTRGLPPSVRRLDLRWSPPDASFTTVYFDLPAGSELEELVLHAPRPLCLTAPCLARCGAVRLTARRAYLGLPQRRGLRWADVDELAARFAQVGYCAWPVRPPLPLPRPQAPGCPCPARGLGARVGGCRSLAVPSLQPTQPTHTKASPTPLPCTHAHHLLHHHHFRTTPACSSC